MRLKTSQEGIAPASVLPGYPFRRSLSAYVFVSTHKAKTTYMGSMRTKLVDYCPRLVGSLPVVTRDIVVQKRDGERGLVSWVVNSRASIVVLSPVCSQPRKERCVKASDEGIVTAHGLDDLAHVVRCRRESSLPDCRFVDVVVPTLILLAISSAV